jgi:hypothetical protein
MHGSTEVRGCTSGVWQRGHGAQGITFTAGPLSVLNEVKDGVSVARDSAAGA